MGKEEVLQLYFCWLLSRNDLYCICVVWCVFPSLICAGGNGDSNIRYLKQGERVDRERKGVASAVSFTSDLFFYLYCVVYVCLSSFLRAKVVVMH